MTGLLLLEGQPLLDPQWPGTELWVHGAGTADGDRVSEGVALCPAHQGKLNT